MGKQQVTIEEMTQNELARRLADAEAERAMYFAHATSYKMQLDQAKSEIEQLRSKKK